jgi:rod shape-determining protein MreC
MIDRTNARAILTGDGGPNPKLDYLRGQNPVQEGDRVMTSGDGGVMPRGLPVGTAVKGLDGRWRVVLAADKSPIDFVRILLFQDFTQLVNQKELAEKHVPPPTQGAQTVGVVAAAPTPAAVKPAAPAPAAATGATKSAATTPAAKPDAKSATAKPAAGAKTPDGKTTAASKPATAKASTTKPAATKTTTTKAATAKPAAKPVRDATAGSDEPPH